MRIRVLLATVALAAFTAAPAAAHTELVSTNPADGSTVTADNAPAAITLTFNEAPLAEGTAIVITDSTGKELPAGQVTINGEQVSTPWPADLGPSGKATVAWRAASDDGHVVSGTFSFAYESLAEVSTIASPMPVTAASAAATTSRGLTGGAAVAIAVLVIAAGAVALLAKRR